MVDAPAPTIHPIEQFDQTAYASPPGLIGSSNQSSGSYHGFSYFPHHGPVYYPPGLPYPYGFVPPQLGFPSYQQPLTYPPGLIPTDSPHCVVNLTAHPLSTDLLPADQEASESLQPMASLPNNSTCSCFERQNECCINDLVFPCCSKVQQPSTISHGIWDFDPFEDSLDPTCHCECPSINPCPCWSHPLTNLLLGSTTLCSFSFNRNHKQTKSCDDSNDCKFWPLITIANKYKTNLSKLQFWQTAFQDLL